MINKMAIATALVFAMTSCSSDDDHEPRRVVVEAYLFSNEPVKDISVKEMMPIDGSQNAAPVTEANVTLTKGTGVFPLRYNPSTLKYEYHGSAALQVSGGDTFNIQIETRERIASSTTVVPLAPQGVKISSTTLRIPPIGYDFNLVDKIRELFANARLELSWDNPGGHYYFVVIERRTDSIDPILPQQLSQQVRDLLSTFRFISDPTTDSSFEIAGVALETYGRHVAKVYRVNPEYVKLFENPPQDSRDLNEPATNIVNGLGIFTAFASDSVFFEVTR